MSRDFTYEVYADFMQAILDAGYAPRTYEAWANDPQPDQRQFILRLDVDRMPQNAVRLARIHADKGMKATYYWRIVDESYDEGCIKEVVAMGHELGYHYEDLTLARGNTKKAMELFEKHLDQLRQFYPVRTLCMHGSPLTKWDNRQVWENHNYKDYDLLAEPYFDTDFNDFFYLTDTGRAWNNTAISVRDHVNSRFDRTVKSTFDIIEKLGSGYFPNQMMHNIHPHRWNSNTFLWTRELTMQSVKNIAKRVLKSRR